ncbi:unnamed protein product [Mytilus coruscus]|uniref:Uncharacterized protein n=1 Tax=Mytilus coruscus TaxID=42192 RepID=A0A6J8A0D8_MYTCO|nr:unnamed protein product [Mytilus coruscus]
MVGTHEIIIGGDLNEDLYNPSNNSRRKQKLNELMVECTDPSSWLLIDEIHKNTESRIKWSTEISEKCPVLQAVKQGGILSTDLYKVYIEDLLNTLENTTSGCEIGETLINALYAATACSIFSFLDAGIPLYWNVGIPLFWDAGIPLFLDAGIPSYWDAGIPFYWDAGIPKKLDAGIQTVGVQTSQTIQML